MVMSHLQQMTQMTQMTLRTRVRAVKPQLTLHSFIAWHMVKLLCLSRGTWVSRLR